MYALLMLHVGWTERGSIPGGAGFSGPIQPPPRPTWPLVQGVSAVLPWGKTAGRGVDLRK